MFRAGIPLKEVRRMTIPQARFLMRHADAVDGHRETARLVVEGIIEIAVAAGLVMRKTQDATTRQPETNAAAVVVPETLIPELQDALKVRMLAEGWQAPPNSSSELYSSSEL